MGDALAQQGVERKGLLRHDMTRTVRMAFYGGGMDIIRLLFSSLSIAHSMCTVVFGPVATKWFQFLQNQISLTSSSKTLMACVATDQLVCAPTMIGVFLSSMSLLERSDPSEKLQRTYWEALCTNWCIWPILQGVNFYLVPLQYRVLVVNVLNIGLPLLNKLPSMLIITRVELLFELSKQCRV